MSRDHEQQAAPKQILIRMPADILPEFSSLAEAEHRPMANMAVALILEAMAARRERAAASMPTG